MPPVTALTDPDLLMREAITGVAVAAYSHGIVIVSHIDNRMPARVASETEGVARFILRGMRRTVESGRTAKIALALWLDGFGPDGTVRATLEIARALDGSRQPVVRLSDLWTGPLGRTTARPRTVRHDAAAESVAVPVRLPAPPAGTTTVAGHWGAAFLGRRLLYVRDVLVDGERLSASMGSIGAELVFAPMPDPALAVLQTDAAAGRAFDVVVLDGHDIGRAAVDLARRIRSDARLARTRIVLATPVRGAKLTADEAALFDVTPWPAAPWRRPLEVMAELFHGNGESPGGAAPAGGSPGCATAAADDGDSGAAIPDLAGRRVLVAEDVAANQVLLKAILRPTGAAVEVVSDGAELLARHRAAPADLILMDLQMPGMGGIAAVRHLRALQGTERTVPVIALTAYARRADRKRALDAGADAHLAKPVVVCEFYALLRRLLLPEPVGGGR